MEPPDGGPSRVREIEVPQARSTPVGWRAPESLDKPRWIIAGRRLGALGRVSNWLIGDWVREGVTRWGEKYAEAARITGFDPHSLRNMAYVASRFDPSLRRDNLTWSHHALVAALEQDRQSYWLDRTSELRWSVADLRTMMRAERRESSKHGQVTPTAPVGNASKSIDLPECSGGDARRSPPVARCPHCGRELPRS
jgi:hypothetical protein